MNIFCDLKSEQDHHDQLPWLFPPGSEKTSVADAGGNWVVFFSWGGGVVVEVG